MRALTLQRY